MRKGKGKGGNAESSSSCFISGLLCRICNGYAFVFLWLEMGWTFIFVALYLHINEFEFPDCEFIRSLLVSRFEDRNESFHVILFLFFFGLRLRFRLRILGILGACWID